MIKKPVADQTLDEVVPVGWPVVMWLWSAIKWIWSALVWCVRFLGRAAGTISAIAAAVAAWLAYRQVDAATEVPFRQTLFQSKLEALEDYRRAVSTYEFDYRVATVSLPHLDNSPNAFDGLTDAEMGDVVKVTAPYIERYKGFIADTDAAAAQWSMPVQGLVKNAQGAAQLNSQCFLELGTRTTADPAYWQIVRNAVRKPCAKFVSRDPHKAFIEEAALVDKAMAAELNDHITGKAPVAIPTDFVGRHD